jgi:hypothetical protein
MAAVVLYVVTTLPPAAQHLSHTPTGVVSGAYHVHSNRSDGSGSLGDIASAAAEAGLQFVIVTDHGDATRRPERPQYLSGVLVIDAVEISTIEGHLVALGLKDASPFPLGAEARDAQEDVHRMGGWTVVAHPDSPHAGLRWRGGAVPVDGIEWLNADSEWRDERAGRLLQTLGHYLFRPSESIASIFDRPSASLKRWDEMSRRRAVSGLAGVDAHARIGSEDQNQKTPRTWLARPTYRDMFGTVSQAVMIAAPLTGDAAQDAASILDALRAGRSYSVVRAIASPAAISFSATDGTRTIGMGESLEGPGPFTITASVAEPSDATVLLFRDGEEVGRGSPSVTFESTGAPVNYRAEARLGRDAVPWIVTNMIRIGLVPSETAPPAQEATVVRRLDNPAAWAPEKHTTSRSDIQLSGGEVAMSYQLSAGPLDGQFAAISYPLEGQVSFESITATLRASAPMRVSVQVRQPGGADGERWHRSVYVDQTPRTVTLDLNDFRLGEEVTDRKPRSSSVRSVLFVVDTWHTKPGGSGTVWVSGVSLSATPATQPATSGR